MQTIPEELFAEGNTLYGSAPDLYATIVPTTTLPENDTGYDLRFAAGTFFDSYQFFGGLSSGACAPAIDPGAADGDCVWSVQRHVITGECQVVGVPSHLAISGEQNNDTFKHWGVCSHVSGGVLSNVGGDIARERRSNTNGYFLIEARQTFAPHRVFMLSISGGTITVLANQLVREVDPEHDIPSGPEGFQPRTLRLHVEESGSGATIRAYRNVPGIGEVQLFGGSLGVGTRLIDGRCGFGMGTRRTDINGTESVGLVDLFRIVTSDGASVMFEDRFERTVRNAATDIVSAGARGRSLASLWIGDSESFNSTGAAMKGLLRRSAGQDAIEAGEDLGGLGTGTGYHLRQFPESSPSQSYAAVFTRLDEDLGLRVEMGICLRFSCVPFPSGNIDCRALNPIFPHARLDYYKRGYSIAVVRDELGNWNLELRHFDGATSIGTIAEVIATASLSAAGLSEDVAFLLSADVQNFDGDVFGQGDFVAISAAVNGSPIDWDPGDQPGIVDGGTFLIDSRTVATTEAGGAGFLIATQGLSSNGPLVQLDSFVSATPQGEVELLPQDMASVPINAEDTGTQGRLELPEDAGLREASVTTPIVHRMESGKVQPIRSQPFDRLRWVVTAVLENDDWEALEELWELNGSDVPFDWTHQATGADLVCLFMEDGLAMQVRHIEFGRTIYEVSFTVEQIFARSLFNP